MARWREQRAEWRVGKKKEQAAARTFISHLIRQRASSRRVLMATSSEFHGRPMVHHSIGGGPGLEVHGQSGSTTAADATGGDDDDAMHITCFTEDVHDVALHFQIIRLQKQIFAWIGCNSAMFGHLYAAATTRPSNMVSVTSLLGGGSDNVGSSIARRLVLKTGLNIVLACNIPKDSPMLEANAERKLVEKLRSLGYIKPKS